MITFQIALGLLQKYQEFVPVLPPGTENQTLSSDSTEKEVQAWKDTQKLLGEYNRAVRALVVVREFLALEGFPAETILPELLEQHQRKIISSQ